MTEHQAVEQARISYATTGERVLTHLPDVTWTVTEPCDVSNGYWYCVFHREAFMTNVERDRHCADNRNHRLTWVCYEHGAEQP